MSFMPNVGTVVRLKDNRIAAVSSFSPTGDDDKVIFLDGHEEPTDAWQISELLTDEETAEQASPIVQLRHYTTILELQAARGALGRIEGWSRYFKEEARTQQRGTMQLIHNEAALALQNTTPSPVIEQGDVNHG